MATRLAAVFGALTGVEAVAIAGSLASGAADERSDIDCYVYAAAPIPVDARLAIATTFAARREMGNEVWEPGDEWIDAQTGRHVDVIYRTPAGIEEQLDRVLVRHEASLGYSTCFWHNVRHSTPLFDRHGWYRELQERAACPYPEPLRRAIIAKNHPILRQTLSSYLAQIERAAIRADSVSIQHRVTALLASYFDILFAVNELPHPGEKRLLQFAVANCAKRPPGFQAQLDALLSIAPHPVSRETVAKVTVLLDGLDGLLAEEGFA